MRCWHCRHEIPDRDLARYLASKGGKRKSDRKREASRNNLARINEKRRQSSAGGCGIAGYDQRFATMEEALKWYAEQKQSSAKAHGT